MTKDTILILLPDGVGLRNFAFTDFHKTAGENGFDVTYWNNTHFDLASLGFNEIKIENPVTHPFTDILKRARTRIDLNRNIKESADDIYLHYRFPLSYSNIKTAFKSALVSLISTLYGSKKGLLKVRQNIKTSERRTAYYATCVETLKRVRPAIVFCSNQRPVSAIAPILAAQDLSIPTATFIFSWDNLPKATMVVETDYYFVWSSHMKNELLAYYPYINESRIFITGTPQYETHCDKSLIMPRKTFFEKYNLDFEKKYICFSGDDITTSPNDAVYLADVARAVRELNGRGFNIGIVFRRCPVDFSDRFDAVLSKNSDLIVAIDPEWKQFGLRWDANLPTPADLILQMNSIAHTELVINVGSSMVFDYASHGKPCAYINYDVANGANSNWSVANIYKFIHFRSMPDKKSVVWLNNRESIPNDIETMLAGSGETVKYAKLWLESINAAPPQIASQRIVDAFKTILKSHPQ